MIKIASSSRHVLAVSLLVLVTPPALAEEAGTTMLLDLDSITVTGTLSEVNRLEAPVAVGVVTREDIDAEGAQIVTGVSPD